MIHMIFEWLVSSARICAYIPERPGACAGSGKAASNKKQRRYVQNFATVPPTPCHNVFTASLGRTQIYARIPRHAMRPPNFDCWIFLYAGSRESESCVRISASLPRRGPVEADARFDS